MKMSWLLAMGILGTAVGVSAANWEDALGDYRHGNYEKVLAVAEEGVNGRGRTEDWHLLKLRTLRLLGRYDDALQALRDALWSSPRSIRIRMEGYHQLQESGHPEEARGLLQEINGLAWQSMRRYSSAEDLVVLGKAALIFEMDPRKVLETFFQVARASDPECRSACLAIGELALGKHDYEMAAEAYEDGRRQFPGDPDFICGLARAYAPGDTRQMLSLLKEALEINPDHPGSNLLLAEHLIDAEEYEASDARLQKVLTLNPHHPKAWAFRAVIGHLQRDPEAAEAALEHAQELSPDNPEVFHIVGRKLSQHYWFAEGAAFQRQALDAREDFLPAKIQLARDLLRLGREAEGWNLAHAVQESDAYDVAAYNLTMLHDHLRGFTTLTNDHFVVRMEPREAAIYGDRVVDLLERAFTILTEKYGAELEERITVEIFPNQNDFGVRTFGMPINPGFLGVCFGPVITANSPAAQTGTPTNWESVLWHEFCHVVTLHLSQNKMPRWLSEGISVYEERLANPAWGQWMDRDYRKMIESGKMTPIRDLSSAFMAPEEPKDLQFAYFQSSLVVEFLVEQFGFGAIGEVLRDLGDGMDIYASLERRTIGLKELQSRFDAYARVQAKAIAPDLEFDAPTSLAIGDRQLGSLLQPDNYWVLWNSAQAMMDQGEWEKAKEPLQRLVDEYPRQHEPDNAYVRLARVQRELGEEDAAFATLKAAARFLAEAKPVYEDLAAMAASRGDWKTVARNAERLLAVDPLSPPPHIWSARAAEQLERPEDAITALRAQLALDPIDPAGIHFQLANLLRHRDPSGAKRHLLQSLELAPRHREAFKLLLQMRRNAPDNET